MQGVCAMKITQERLEEILREELAAVTEGELEEGMFGLTTTSSSDQKLKDQRDMWLSRVHSLYIALKGHTSKQQADMVLDSIGMSPADLRPSERSRLEEVWGKQKPFGEDPKNRKPKVDPWATAHKRGGPGGSVHRAGPAKLGPERPMTPKSAEQHAKDIEHGSREYDATRRLPEELSEMFGASDVGSFDDQKEKLTRIIKNYLKTIYQEYMDDMTGDPTSHEENKRAAMSAAKGDLAAEIDEIIKDLNSFLGEARRKRETPAQKRRRSEKERRDAELPPKWRSDRPEVKTTSLQDLKKIMKRNQ